MQPFCFFQHATNTSKHFEDLRHRGLVSFAEHHCHDNAVSLCPSCYLWFEHPLNPRFVFVPDDIQYFIQHESLDFSHRKLAFETGSALTRRNVPSATKYREYQEKQGVQIPPDNRVHGGLYRRYLLQSTNADEPAIEEIDVNRYPLKPWAGCPMAAFAKTFPTLVRWLHKYPEDVGKELWQLLELYADNDRMLSRMKAQVWEPEAGLEQSKRAADIPVNKTQEATHKPQDDGHSAHNDPQTQQQALKRKRITPESSTAGKSQATTDEESDENPSPEPGQAKSLVWGPEGTSQDAMENYQVRSRISEKYSEPKGEVSS